MPDALTIRDAITLVAPGFVALKLFYLFRQQRQRSQWEWTAWSVIASVPLEWMSARVMPWLASVSHWPPDVADAATRGLVAVVAGVGAGAAWGSLKGVDREPFRRVRRLLTDSAWDEVVEDAWRHDRWFQVVIARGAEEKSYRGFLSTAGREDAGAERWIYLEKPQELLQGKWVDVAGTHGLLFHADKLERIRVITPLRRATRLARSNLTPSRSRRPV